MIEVISGYALFAVSIFFLARGQIISGLILLFISSAMIL